MVSQRIGGNEGNILWEKNQNNYSKYRLRLRGSKNRVIWKQMLFILAARMSCIKIKIKCSSEELVFLSKIILVYTCTVHVLLVLCILVIHWYLILLKNWYVMILHITG